MPEPLPGRRRTLTILQDLSPPPMLATPFDRLDAGCTDHFRGADILLDLPEIVTVARMHFTTGVGYEVFLYESAESQDFDSVVALVGHFHMIGLERNQWGTLRFIYWDHDSTGDPVS